MLGIKERPQVIPVAPSRISASITRLLIRLEINPGAEIKSRSRKRPALLPLLDNGCHRAFA